MELQDFSAVVSRFRPENFLLPPIQIYVSCTISVAILALLHDKASIWLQVPLRIGNQICWIVLFYWNFRMLSLYEFLVEKNYPEYMKYSEYSIFVIKMYIIGLACIYFPLHIYIWSQWRFKDKTK